MTKVLNEIINQLRGQKVNLKKKVLVKVDDNTLRVHTPGKLGKIGGSSVDIKYDRGRDLYDVSIHKIDDKTFKVKTCRSSGVYFDSLPNFFNPKIVKTMKCSRWK